MRGPRAPYPSPLEGNPPQEPEIHSKASMATEKKRLDRRQSTNSNKSLHLRMGRMDGRKKQTSHEIRGIGEPPLWLPLQVKTRLLLFVRAPFYQSVQEATGYSACCTDQSNQVQTDICIFQMAYDLGGTP